MRASTQLITLGVLLCASPASAGWLRAGTTSSGSVWYMDPSRIQRSGDRVRAWVKIDSSQDGSVKFRKEMRLYGIICSKQSIKLISYTEYDSYDKVVGSKSFPDYAYADIGYTPVTPETLAEVVHRLACLANAE